jgi:hypothetical protein
MYNNKKLRRWIIMGKKLKFDDASNSHRAIMDYEDIYDNSGFRKILVKQNGEEKLVLDSVKVMSMAGGYGDSDLRRLDILWEESGLKNYKDRGLYGIYSADYCHIEFENQQLIVHSENNIDIYIF